MRARSLLLVSLGLNLALGAVWLAHWRAAQSSSTHPPAPVIQTNTVARNRILPIVRRHFFSWSEIESTNYDDFVANLRDIACPESTIRDIIVADVSQLYARKRTAENLAEPQLAALEDERRALLQRLLGPDWDEDDIQLFLPHIPLALDGPVLGQLSEDVKKRVQEIAARAQAKILAYEKNQHIAGLKADPAQLALIEQDEQAELAAILAPAQLEEFEIQFSAKGESLRRETAVMQHFNINLSPDESRNLFRATDALDAIDAQLQSLGDSTDAAADSQRGLLSQQRESLLKRALTADHYAQYSKLKDPAYRDALESAQASGASPQAADAIYKINQATADEQARIAADTKLTDVQKQIELKKIELAQLQAQAQATGQIPPAPPAPPTATVATQPHIITPGENLGILARTFSTRVNDIIAVNPGVDFHALKAGDTINLPVVVPAPPAQ